MTDYAAIGRKKLLEIDGEAGVQVEETLNRICPDLARYLIEYSFIDIYARGLLSHRDRQAATIAALAAKGTAPSQLRFHIGGGLRAGLSEAEIVEIMLLISVYAGFPAALNGILATREVATSMMEK
jgi:4-carboxymuconolactone decarboxylase